MGGRQSVIRVGIALLLLGSTLAVAPTAAANPDPSITFYGDLSGMLKGETRTIGFRGVDDSQEGTDLSHVTVSMSEHLVVQRYGWTTWSSWAYPCGGTPEYDALWGPASSSNIDLRTPGSYFPHSTTRVEYEWVEAYADFRNGGHGCLLLDVKAIEPTNEAWIKFRLTLTDTSSWETTRFYRAPSAAWQPNDQQGFNTFEETFSIGINQKPSVDLQVQASSTTPLRIRADASSSNDPEGSQLNFDWFYDGRKDYARSAILDYTFKSGGNKEITVCANDENPGPCASRTVYVHDRPVLDEPTCIQSRLTFECTANGRDPEGASVQYAWDFDGDNHVDRKGQAVEFTYTSNGEKQISAWSYDGEWYSELQRITVEAGNRAPIVATPSCKADDLQVTCTTQGWDPDGDAIEISWDFDADNRKDDDGTTGRWTYSAAGARTVRVQSYDGDLVSPVSSTTVHVSFGDDDGDGVPSPNDQCPGYDDEIDQNGNGVPDGCDTSSTTGPSPDSDHDGIPDSQDQCPGHDDRLDADGDGIPDGCDARNHEDARLERVSSNLGYVSNRYPVGLPIYYTANCQGTGPFDVQLVVNGEDRAAARVDETTGLARAEFLLEEGMTTIGFDCEMAPASTGDGYSEGFWDIEVERLPDGFTLPAITGTQVNGPRAPSPSPGEEIASGDVIDLIYHVDNPNDDRIHATLGLTIIDAQGQWFRYPSYGPICELPAHASVDCPWSMDLPDLPLALGTATLGLRLTDQDGLILQRYWFDGLEIVDAATPCEGANRDATKNCALQQQTTSTTTPPSSTWTSQGTSTAGTATPTPTSTVTYTPTSMKLVQPSGPIASSQNNGFDGSTTQRTVEQVDLGGEADRNLAPRSEPGPLSQVVEFSSQHPFLIGLLGLIGGVLVMQRRKLTGYRQSASRASDEHLRRAMKKSLEDEVATKPELVVERKDNDAADILNEEAEEVAPPIDWSKLTVLQLRDELRARGMKVSGVKQELIERLEDQSQTRVA